MIPPEASILRVYSKANEKWHGVRLYRAMCTNRNQGVKLIIFPSGFDYGTRYCHSWSRWPAAARTVAQDYSPNGDDLTKDEAHVTVRTEPAKLGADGGGRGPGALRGLPDHIATLTPAVEGHVHELLVMQGDPVKKGQPIVELDEAVAQADLAEKTATRDGLKASLALLKSLPRPEERRANELAVEQAKVAVERARALFESPESLRRMATWRPSSSSSMPEKALEAGRSSSSKRPRRP